MKKVCIVAASRTPIGSFMGGLSSLSAIELGTVAIQSLFGKVNIKNICDRIDEVFMGNVIAANLGQAPARQTALGAGISHNTPCTLVNKVCASGMKSVMLGAQSIMAGQNDIVVAGGMESMSNIPHYLPAARRGYKYGHGKLVDGLSRDGLQEVYNDFPMGNCAEITAREMNITREMQDAHAIESYRRAEKSAEAGKFKNEITPITVSTRKGEIIVEEDEEYKNVSYEKIPSLRTVFQKDGTVTAANASTINDGAAALLLMSEEKAQELGLKPLAWIRGMADAAKDPVWFTTAPSEAVPKALKDAKVRKEEVDYYEINEAFSAVSIANNLRLGLDSEKVNVYGGAVSLGHPLGCSGARILVTLLNVLQTEGGKIGVAAICNGGGGASAMVLEKN